MTTKSIDDLPFVLTLTILDDETLTGGKITKGSRVRYCVRDPKCNETHPNVVSVPTQRLPYSVAKEILSTAIKTGRQDKTILFEDRFISNSDHDGHDPIIYAVESLLCRKLGVEALLESEDLTFNASLSGLHQGTARYSLGKTEDLQMLNVRVHITKGGDRLPSTTTTYRVSDWTTVSGFKTAWETKDPTHVGVSFKDAITGVCVNGLCILSTYDIIKSEVGQ